LQDPGEINYMMQQGIEVDNNQNTQAKCNCNIARQEFHTRACFFSLSSLLISGVLGSSSFISLSKSLISLQHPHAPINSAPLLAQSCMPPEQVEALQRKLNAAHKLTGTSCWRESASSTTFLLSILI